MKISSIEMKELFPRTNSLSESDISGAFKMILVINFRINFFVAMVDLFLEGIKMLFKISIKKKIEDRAICTDS